METGDCVRGSVPARPYLADGLQLALRRLSVVQGSDAVQARRAVLGNQAHEHARVRQL